MARGGRLPSRTSDRLRNRARNPAVMYHQFGAGCGRLCAHAPAAPAT
jgi:hypothetical protein